MSFHYKEKAVRGFSVHLETVELEWWFYLLSGVVSIGLAYNFLRKSQKNASRLDYLLSLVFSSAISYIIILFTVLITGTVVKQVRYEFMLPKYSAKIIDPAYSVTVNTDDGITNEYRPLVGFADEHHHMINIPLNMAPEKAFKKDRYIEVGYEDGMSSAYALNPRRYIIYFGELIFLGIFYSGLLFIIGYGLHNQYMKNRAATFSMAIFGYIIIPGMMVFMAALMSEAMFDKLAGSSNMSWGGFFICLFFVIILAFSLYGYFMFMFALKPLKGKTIAKSDNNENKKVSF
ncbi:hypothetical protein [Elizabethkingia meningoseptica]|uniref:hypothetical protein n=1 Tax=Elizabethkingia meningoseptica TaxID=238 RepID=UPI0023B0940E|nr:hypothetical protein [Elizabethkingia meningoseptica]MDE5429671.1 hypothetical protein [Elizabethkingia meningoseptica]